MSSAHEAQPVTVVELDITYRRRYWFATAFDFLKCMSALDEIFRTTWQKSVKETASTTSATVCDFLRELGVGTRDRSRLRAYITKRVSVKFFFDNFANFT